MPIERVPVVHKFGIISHSQRLQLQERLLKQSYLKSIQTKRPTASKYVYTGFPLGLENLEKWEGIFQSGKSQGILNRLEKSGKSQIKSHKILENSGNLR